MSCSFSLWLAFCDVICSDYSDYLCLGVLALSLALSWYLIVYCNYVLIPEGTNIVL